MNTPLVLLEGDQLEIDFDLDKPQFSICPQCSSDIIKLADGCDVCGWREKQSNSVWPYSIPCNIKQPNHPQLSGIIRQDLGERFIVEIPDANSTLTIPKLYVFPDFSQLDKSFQESSPPSKIPPTKRCDPADSQSAKERAPRQTRRKKGDGTGYIYRRNITRKGNQYQESYYRYRDESGKRRSKYIPQRLLDRVQEAESLKLPVADILVLLGGGKISRGELSGTSNDESLPRSNSEFINRGEPFSSFDGENLPIDGKSDELISLSRGELATPPSTRRRKQGQGTGYIECKSIKRQGKEYKQYWYHYEEWWEGELFIKSSKYIPREKEGKIIRMNDKKAPVEKILKVLESKSKRKR
ncbi:hypothetical protein Xen7305DRAFT_00031990 [Xenococcus sp. PCC 7305]|uniref:hypothetical protein n=1 Tax=Xenococcus sp. PCC 7305 TaxID=102125 RepID=UPI0002AD03AA|nr:hypothetical protein [Xenococcus sp. PCC 7305]ELS03475.1 hypothetical protein Xen7305DRAFT_00031990 [Xenococcus sp. PCC 7305]